MDVKGFPKIFHYGKSQLKITATYKFAKNNAPPKRSVPTASVQTLPQQHELIKTRFNALLDLRFDIFCGLLGKFFYEPFHYLKLILRCGSAHLNL
jgi:hypothetical protein